jgi:hypothetical protein
MTIEICTGVRFLAILSWQLGRRDDAAAAIGEKRVSERSLSRCDGERGDAALKLGDPLLQNVCRGIGYAAVAKARDLQIEQCALSALSNS